MDLETRSVLNPSPQRMTGPSLLHELVRSSSDDTALEHLEEGTLSSYTYEDLHTASDNIARDIQAARKQDADKFIVPVLHQQSPCLYAALLGILKAGGAFCPLNLDVPPERLSFILSDVAATVVVISSDLLDKFDFPAHVQVVPIEPFETYTVPGPGRVPPNISPADLAYVMYTSGSTGVPKGVAISHDAATQALLAHDCHVPELSRFFQFAAPTFDVSVFEIFFPLSRGNTLISATRSETLEDLPSVLNKANVDACELTPTVAAGLLRSRQAVPGLKTLLTIGEMLNKPVVEEFGGKADGSSILWAMYGPTEATIHCTLMPSFESAMPVGIIGVPLKTVSCFVIDPENPTTEGNDLNVLPKGEVGELAVGGFQLAEGYLNRPEQTAKAFIETSSGRVYRTGDKARLNDDGLLECFGRLSDGQVKLRGQRIELGEIEQAMLKTPNCHVATALVVNSMLVGFCVADASVSEDNILSGCRTWLPPYMVPSEIIILDDLPKLPSGKVDRPALKLILSQREEAGDVDQSTSMAEHDHQDRVIRAVAQCLETEVAPRMTLRSLGVDSLRAIKMASVLRSLDLNISVADILRARTVSDLIPRIQTSKSISTDSEEASYSLLPHLDQIILGAEHLVKARDKIEEIFPCTPLQTAMLTASYHDPRAYHNEMEFEVDDDISANELARGLGSICDSNEILRTCFVAWERQVVAVVFSTCMDDTVQIVSPEDEAQQSNATLTWLKPLQIRIVTGYQDRRSRILISAHHAIYDGWSIDAILTDLWRFTKGDDVPSRPQFRQIVNHQATLVPETQERDKRFWADHLSTWKRKPFPVLIEKPATSSAPSVVTQQCSLDGASINQATQRIGCSTSSLFLAALAQTWKGILGSEDFTIGTTTSGRALPISHIEDIIGPCIATLPLRVQFQNLETSDQLIKSIDNAAKRLIEYSALSLSEIRKLAGLQTFEGLYDVLFTFQESLFSKSVKEGPFRQVRHLDRLETKLLIEVEPMSSGYSLQATFHTDVIDQSMATQMLQQMANYLYNIASQEAASPSIVLSSESLPLSVHNERVPEPSHVLDLAAGFEVVAEKHPDLDAIDFMMSGQDSTVRETLTYHNLNSQANQVARLLQAHGAEPGMVIGIIMEKSVSLYVGILAILKTGCAYLPLLPSTPPLRVKEILSQASVRLCLVDTDDGPALNETTTTQWLIPKRQYFEHLSDANICIPPDGDRLAYVIFTSGTTGKPKGVSVTQRNITCNVLHLSTVYPVKETQQGRFLQACSQAFDVSVFEIFFCWLSSMCLCSGTNDTLFADIEQSARTLRVSHLSLTPTVAAMIDPENVPTVEFLVTAGEPLTRTVLNKWGSLLWQGYGPSETTNICTVKRMDKKYNIEHLGHAFPNTSTVVLQAHGQSILPLGWVGEFCFGGDQVAQGYMGDAALTAAKFMYHATYGRLYRSGDLGRMLPDGTLVILGRIDTQVKLRGQRIETAEIDHVLSMHQGLHSAATLLLNTPKSSSSQCLASFLSFSQSRKNDDIALLPFDPTTQLSLLATLKARLPAYMIPTYLIPISSIPQTSSGKCDSQRLRSIFSELSTEQLNQYAHAHEGAEDDGEWLPLEKTIRNTIAGSLGIPEIEIGRWSSLSGMGLDSISAIRVAQDLSTALKTRVPISALLLYPCIALLAKQLAEAKQEHTVGEPLLSDELTTSVISRMLDQTYAVAKVLPCTPLQEGMLSQGRGSYYNRVLLRLRSTPDRIRGCWEEVCRRHEIFRTCFMTTSDRNTPVVQVVLDGWTIPWRSYSSNDLSIVGAVQTHMASLLEPVDSMVPPLSLALIANRKSYFLSFLCHHALYDGTAIGALWREIEALARGEPLLPPIPYEPFLRAMRELPVDYLSFWKEKLRSRQNRLVFAGQRHTTAAQQAIHTATFELRLDETQRALQSVQVGLQSLCQAAWAIVLCSLTGSEDVVFGNVISGRNVDVAGIERLVAPCFNSIPVRKTLDKSVQNVQLLQELQSLNTEMLPYHFSPLREIAKLAGSRRLFDTLLLVQQPLEEMDAAIWTLEEDVGDMDVPLVCEVTPCPNLNSVAVKLYYDMNTLTEEEASTISSEFTQSVSRLIRSPYASVLLEPLNGLQTRPQVADSYPHVDDGAGDPEAGTSSWDALESQIRTCLSILTGFSLSSIGKTTSMFRLGIDSISAIQLVSMMRERGYSITTADVMENSTCERLAQKLLLRSAPAKRHTKSFDFDAFRESISEQVSRAVPTEMPLEAILPCTPLQCAMANSSRSDNSQYMNLISFQVESGLRAADIAAAWETVRSQHSMLRTALIPIDNGNTPFAMVRYPPRALELPLEVIDSRDEAPKFENSMRIEVATSLLMQPHRPPWKVVLTSTKEDRIHMHLVLHHALYDAVSLQTILSDLASALGGNKIRGTANPEPGLSEMMMKDATLNANAEAFWKSLGPQVVINRFPVLTPLRESEGQRETAIYSSRMKFGTILKKCKDSDVTVQALIEAAWTRILAEYTGEDSIVFGVTLSTRRTEATKNTPLPCITTLPVIARNQPSNSDLLKSILGHDAKLASFRNSSLGDVQRWVGHPASPIFDTLVTYQGHLEQTSADFPWTILDDVGLVEYPVALEIKPMPDDQVILSLGYSTDVVPPKHAEHILRQFDATMYGLLHCSTSRDDELFQSDPSLFSVTPAELEEIATEIKCLHEFVERQSIRTPHAPALEFHQTATSIARTWNYRQLNDMGNRVAFTLRRLGLEGSLVAVHFHKCPEAYFSILGALKAGFAFVALDPSMPRARKEFIMRDSGACCLLAADSSIPDFDVDVPTRIISESGLTALEGFDPSVASENISPFHTCYCLYTSGTTGTPKGCEITHENAVQAMMAFQHLFRGRWNEDSRWLQFAALHFDVSILEQYWTWSVGMTLVVTPRDVILDDLAGTLARLKITHLDLTPSLARLLDPQDVPDLWNGVFITGGESLRQEILDAWGPKGVIYNAYGPTEATIGVTTHSQVPQNGRPSNIGKPFLNVGTYVLHPGTDLPVLRGAVGELCIAGKLVGKGYINREDTTRERFPWLPRFSERVYRTGDLVRLLSDGSFDFLGRADDQVKLRGQRLELGEIDHVIRSAMPEIEDLATIVVTQKSPDRSVLVCFLSNGKGKDHELRPMKSDRGLDRQAKAACRSQLPSYMIPTYFLEMPYIPLSINNKAEHKTLRSVFEALSPDELMDLTSSSAVSLSMSAQKALDVILQAFSDFTKSDDISLTPTSSIFEAGIDSINVLLFVAALRRRGLQCSAAVVLQNPILADLADALSAQKPAGEANKNVREAQMIIKASFHRNPLAVRNVLGAGPEKIEYIAPCTPLQEGMVTTALSRMSGNAYFVSLDLRLSPAADIERLRDAWLALIQRHAIMRTVFLQTPEGCIQVASREADLDWVNQATESERDARKLLWLQANEHNILKPLQFTVVRSSDQTRLAVDIFHGIYDGVSLDCLLQQVKDIYNNTVPKEAPAFIEVMAHGPLWQFDHCKEFWIDHFRGWRASNLWTAQPDVHDGSQAIVATKNLPQGSIGALLKSLRVTHQTLFLALWAAALSQVFKSLPTIGLIIGGRSLDLSGVEETVGPLFNTLPFYSGSVHSQNWSDLVTRCHEFSSAILNFQHVPLRKIQKWCCSGQNVLETLLSVQPESNNGKDQELWTVEEPTAPLDYPLALEVTIKQDGNIHLHLVADRKFVTEAVVERLLDQLETLCASVVQDSETQWTEELLDAASFSQPSVNAHAAENKMNDKFIWSATALTVRQTLAEIANCKTESIEAHTSILELGLDSIDVLRLGSKLREEGIDVAPSTLMNFPTIATLMPQIEDGVTLEHRSDNGIKMDELRHKLRSALLSAGRDLSTVETILPTTPLQEGMIKAMMDSDFQQYFNHEVLQLDPAVDLDKLHKAWSSVVESNPILRTGFSEVSDETVELAFCQVVHGFEGLDISKHELGSLPESSGHFETAKSLARQTGGWSDMFQVRFASCGEDKYMVVSVAHALYDGWSLGLVYQDLQRAYEGKLLNRPSPEGYLAQVINRDNNESRYFWESFLYAAEPTILCPDEETTISSSEICFRDSVSVVEAADVTQFCRDLGISLQVLCYACWSVILAHQARQLDVSFGSVLSGRDFEGAEELMFPTMNTVAQRCILSGTCASFLSYLEQGMRSIRPHQSYPLRRALASATEGRALFDTLFMVQKSLGSGERAEHRLFKSVMGGSETEYPICAESEVLGDQLVWRVASKSSKHGASVVAGILRDLDAVLQYFIHSPDRNVVNLLGEEVSICGLDPVSLRPVLADGPSPSKVALNYEGHQWSPPASAIAEVLSSVSGVPVGDIKIWNSIYHLGLDSITAIKLSSLLRAKGIALRSRDLLQAADIAEMARIAEERSGTEAKQESETAVYIQTWAPPASVSTQDLLSRHGLSETDVEAILPALPMQLYMIRSWYSNGGSLFFPEFRIRLPRGTSSTQIEHAKTTLREETPLLRTYFCPTGKDECPLLQVVMKSNGMRGHDAWWGCWAETDSDGEVLLTLKIHHALYDAFSLSYLLQRLTSLCSGTNPKPEPVPLSPWVPCTTRSSAETRQAQRQRFWTDYLGDAISDHHNAALEPTGFSKTRTSHVDSDTNCSSPKLRQAASAAGTSVQALFLAAYATSTATETHGKDFDGSVVFGMYFANRDEAETLPSSYPTLCITPIKVHVSPSQTLLSSAQAIQRDLNTISSQGAADVGLWEIKRWTGLTIDRVVNFIADRGAAAAAELQWLPPRETEGGVSGVVTPETLGDWDSPLMSSAYPATIEIEASMNENTLTVGVFGPQTLLTEGQAADMVRRITTTLLEGAFFLRK